MDSRELGKGGRQPSSVRPPVPQRWESLVSEACRQPDGFSVGGWNAGVRQPHLDHATRQLCLCLWRWREKQGARQRNGHGDGHFDVTWSGAAGKNPVDLAIADLDETGLPTSRSQTTRRIMSRCSSGSPEGPSNAGTTRGSASMSRRTRTPFDCTTSTPMVTRTFWSTTGRPSPSGCSGVAGTAHSRGRRRSTSAATRTGA